MRLRPKRRHLPSVGGGAGGWLLPGGSSNTSSVPLPGGLHRHRDGAAAKGRRQHALLFSFASADPSVTKGTVLSMHPCDLLSAASPERELVSGLPVHSSETEGHL